jgi:uncharacterized membrane protein
MKKRMLWTPGLVLVLVSVAIAGDAPPLTFKFRTVNVPGAVQTTPGGINNADVSVGQYQDKNMAFHGYILNGKKLKTLDDPNGTNTLANDLNPNGAICVVGYYLNSAGAAVGFLYRKGKFTDIPGPTGATASAANSINDKGDIVGYYVDSSGTQHGFLLKGKTYTTLDVPEAVGTGVDAINNKGTMVVFWVDSKGNGQSSITYDGGKTYKTINVPEAVYSAANAINNEGDIVYTWLDSADRVRGALRHNGKYYKFDYPKAVFTYGGGLNDRRTITGGYEAHKNGPFAGFEANRQR